MSVQAPTSDAQLLGLLRIAGPLSTSELADAMEVTVAAVRQRLVRLLDQEAIQCEASGHSPGRPRHLYSLAEKGLQRTDSPFTAAASAFWENIRQSSGPKLRRTTLRRIARALGSDDADQIRGKTSAERKKSLAKLLNQQQNPVSVKKRAVGVPVDKPAAAPKTPAKPSRGITPEQLKAVSQMIKTIGGFGRLREILVVIKEVGGVTKLKDLLDGD